MEEAIAREKAKRIDKKTIIIAAVIVAMILYCLPIIISIAYSVHVADDYSCAGFINSNGLNPFEYMAYYYMNWQGTYTSLLLMALLTPILHGGMALFRFEMIIWFLLTASAIVFLVRTFTKTFFEMDTFIGHIISFLTIYIVFSYTCYTENYYWFTSSMVYTLVMACMLLAIPLLIKSVKLNNNLIYILAIVLGVIACGGALPIPGFGCYTALVICFVSFLKNKKIKSKYNLTFIVWVIAAVINAAAPGNFVRKEIADSTGIHVFSAIRVTIGMYLNRVNDYCTNTSLVAILLLGLICGIYAGMHRTKKLDKELKLGIVLELFAPLVTLFPVVLGNYSQATNTARVDLRCWFIVDIAMYISLVGIVLLIGILLAENFKSEQLSQFAMTMIGILSVVLILTDDYSFTNSIPYQTYKQLQAGEYQNYYSQFLKIDEKLKNSAGEDVVLLSSEIPDEINNFYNFYIDIEPTDWVNIDISTYYGLNSLRREVDD